MKTWQWLLYGSLLVIGEYFAFQNYDWATHQSPIAKYFGLPPEAVFAVPILLILVIYWIIGMLGQAKPQASEMGVPIAAVFIGNPKNQDYSKYNHVFDDVTPRFLFLVNAQRSYKQKHKGERIIAGLRYTDKEKQKWDNMLHYYYVHDDHLSREEIALYMLNEGEIMLQDSDYAIAFSKHPKLIHSTEITIYEVKGLPKTLDDMAIGMFAAGHATQAQDIIEASKPEMPFKRR